MLVNLSARNRGRRNAGNGVSHTTGDMELSNSGGMGFATAARTGPELHFKSVTDAAYVPGQGIRVNVSQSVQGHSDLKQSVFDSSTEDVGMHDPPC
jgi:hypothetical protein